MRKVYVLNGPNLGRLGTRQPDVYGATTHAMLAEHLVATGEGLGLQVEVRQTDDEATMIGWLHEAADDSADVVLNEIELVAKAARHVFQHGQGGGGNFRANAVTGQDDDFSLHVDIPRIA